MSALDEINIPEPSTIRREIGRLRGEIAQLKELLRLAELRRVSGLGRRISTKRPRNDAVVRTPKGRG